LSQVKDFALPLAFEPIGRPRSAPHLGFAHREHGLILLSDQSSDPFLDRCIRILIVLAWPGSRSNNTLEDPSHALLR
jgi:hypothetical protein